MLTRSLLRTAPTSTSVRDRHGFESLTALAGAALGE